MKHLLIPLALGFLASFTQAAIPPDTKVTLLKVKNVTVEDRAIVIVAEKATTLVTLLAGDQGHAYTGETRDGLPVTTVQILSDEATFTIKQDRYSRPGGVLENVWKNSMALAKQLQDGEQVGTVSLSFYAPDIVIQRHEVTSIIGFGYLLAKP